MSDDPSNSRRSSLEKQRRFLRGDRYMGFHDEPAHGSSSGGTLHSLPEQAQQEGGGVPLDVIHTLLQKESGRAAATCTLIGIGRESIQQPG